MGAARVVRDAHAYSANAMYKWAVEPTAEQPAFKDYDEALRIVLEIPPLADETAGATRVVRCLVRPSFHPECSLSVVERGFATELAVRVPARSVWRYFNARDGTPVGDPLVGWVKPAVSVERLALTTEAAASWRSVMDNIERAPFAETSAWGLDGIRVDTVLWRPGSERSFRVWFCELDDTDNRHRLVRSVLEMALTCVQWTQSMGPMHHVLSRLRP